MVILSEPGKSKPPCEYLPVIVQSFEKSRAFEETVLGKCPTLFFPHEQTSLHLVLMCHVGFTNHIVCDKAVPAYRHVSSRKKWDKVSVARLV